MVKSEIEKIDIPGQSPAELISGFISQASPEMAQICIKLREIIHKFVPQAKEQWKWGPNYNLNGMLCGFAYAKQHVSLTFFVGSAMSDKHNLFNYGFDNAKTRTIKIEKLEQINESMFKDYLLEAVEIAMSRFKPNMKLSYPVEFIDIFKKDGVWQDFEKLNYTSRKEILQQFSGAKKEETRIRRMAKIIHKLKNGIKINL